CMRSAPEHRAEDRLATIVQPPTGPIIRRASPHRRRPTRRQIARRRAGVVLAIVAVVGVAWFAWPFGGDGQTGADGGNGQPSSGGGDGNGGDNGGNGDGVVGPDSPIKHVVFIVKENRTFNSYFATYGHGAVGATTGGTLTCTDGVCTAGPDYDLKPAPDVAPHDITH